MKESTLGSSVVTLAKLVMWTVGIGLALLVLFLGFVGWVFRDYEPEEWE